MVGAAYILELFEPRQGRFTLLLTDPCPNLAVQSLGERPLKPFHQSSGSVASEATVANTLNAGIANKRPIRILVSMAVSTSFMVAIY